LTGGLPVSSNDTPGILSRWLSEAELLIFDRTTTDLLSPEWTPAFSIKFAKKNGSDIIKLREILDNYAKSPTSSDNIELFIIETASQIRELYEFEDKIRREVLSVFVDGIKNNTNLSKMPWPAGRPQRREVEKFAEWVVFFWTEKLGRNLIYAKKMDGIRNFCPKIFSPLTLQGFSPGNNFIDILIKKKSELPTNIQPIVGKYLLKRTSSMANFSEILGPAIKRRFASIRRMQDAGSAV